MPGQEPHPLTPTTGTAVPSGSTRVLCSGPGFLLSAARHPPPPTHTLREQLVLARSVAPAWTSGLSFPPSAGSAPAPLWLPGPEMRPWERALLFSRRCCCAPRSGPPTPPSSNAAPAPAPESSCCQVLRLRPVSSWPCGQNRTGGRVTEGAGRRGGRVAVAQGSGGAPCPLAVSLSRVWWTGWRSPAESEPVYFSQRHCLFTPVPRRARQGAGRRAALRAGSVLRTAGSDPVSPPTGSAAHGPGGAQEAREAPSLPWPEPGPRRAGRQGHAHFQRPQTHCNLDSRF